LSPQDSREGEREKTVKRINLILRSRILIINRLLQKHSRSITHSIQTECNDEKW